MVIRHASDLALLETATAVIDAVGGTAVASRLAASASPSGACSQQSVTNWRSSGRLPPYTFLVFTEALAALGYQAPSTLWGIAPARQRSIASPQ